jgi:hypothetical protein
MSEIKLLAQNLLVPTADIAPNGQKKGDPGNRICLLG